MIDRVRVHRVEPLPAEVAGLAPQPDAANQLATLCRIERTIHQAMGEVRDELERVASALTENTAAVREVAKRLRESDERMEHVLNGATRNLERVAGLVTEFARIVQGLRA
jgi:methyl-accepting chemotaxis protein